MEEFTISLIFCLISSVAVGAVCPPAEILSPCTCFEVSLGITCKDINGRFNIKSKFDEITPYIEEAVVFNTLVISGTSIVELPSFAINKLKFLSIQITANRNLEYIYPDAINASTAVTKSMALTSNYLTNIGQEKNHLFQFLNRFSQLESLSLTGNQITSIPKNSFTSALSCLTELKLDGNRIATIATDAFDLLNLKMLSIYSNALTEIPVGGFGQLPSLLEFDGQSNSINFIGKHAFTSSPNISKIALKYNSLTSNGFDPEAFFGIGGNEVAVDLTFNSITQLKEEVFQPLLQVSKSISVGGQTCNRNGCTTRYLICDQQADWICTDVNHYKSILTGFRCTGVGDIWAYCEMNSKN